MNGAIDKGKYSELKKHVESSRDEESATDGAQKTIKVAQATYRSAEVPFSTSLQYIGL